MYAGNCVMRYVGLSINKGLGGGSVKTEEFTRSSGITTDSSNNVTAVTLGDTSYSNIVYNSDGLIAEYTESIGGVDKNWELTYDSNNLVSTIAEASPPGTQAQGLTEDFTPKQIGCMCICVWYEVSGSNYGCTWFTNDEWATHSTLWFSNPEGMGGQSPTFSQDYFYWDTYFSPRILIPLDNPGGGNTQGWSGSYMKMGGMANYNGTPSLYGGQYSGTRYYSTSSSLNTIPSNNSQFIGDPNGANQGGTSGLYWDGFGVFNNKIYGAGSFSGDWRVVYMSSDNGQTFNEIYSAGGTTSGLEGDNMYGIFRVYPEAPYPLMWWVKNKQQNTYNTFTSSDGVNWTDQGVIPSNGPNIGTSWYGGAYGNIIHNKHTGKFYHTRNSSSVYESTDGISWSTFSSPSLGQIWNVALANDGSLFGLVWTNNGNSHHANIYKWTASGSSPNKTLNSSPSLVKTITELDSTPNGTNTGGVDSYGTMYPAHIYGPPYNW